MGYDPSARIPLRREVLIYMGKKQANHLDHQATDNPYVFHGGKEWLLKKGNWPYSDSYG